MNEQKAKDGIFVDLMALKKCQELVDSCFISLIKGTTENYNRDFSKMILRFICLQELNDYIDNLSSHLPFSRSFRDEWLKTSEYNKLLESLSEVRGNFVFSASILEEIIKELVDEFYCSVIESIHTWNLSELPDEDLHLMVINGIQQTLKFLTDFES